MYKCASAFLISNFFCVYVAHFVASQDFRHYLLLMFSLLLPLLFFSSLTFADSHTKTILFIGDSLTAGYGVKKAEAFPALLEKDLNKIGHNVKVINGAESGAISSAALPRLQFYTRKIKPLLVVISIGGNDARAARPIQSIQDNIAKTIEFAQKEKLKVILTGQKVFANFDPEYSKKFEALYGDLAKKYKVTFVPFLLEGVGGKPELNIEDGFHPNAKGHQVISQTLKPFLLEVL